jgi:hypothetical protein
MVILGAMTSAVAVVQAGGRLSLTLICAAFGAEVGGLVGRVLGEFIEERHVRYLEEQLSHGGLLIWVRISSEEQENLVRDILKRHSARDVHAQALMPVA